MTTDALQDPAPVYTCTLQVRWADFDQLRHVNNTKYIEYAQEARLLYLRDRWISQGLSAPDMVVRRMEVDYLRPVLPAEHSIEADLAVLHIGRTSFTLRHTLRSAEGTVYCVCDAVMVAFDTATSSPKPLDDISRHILNGGSPEDMPREVSARPQHQALEAGRE